MSKDKLKLIVSPDALGEVNNFWRTCPRLLDYMPENNCQQASPDADDRCPWWINSDKHNSCFWKFVRDESDENGVMQELTQSQIAKLFSWSTTKTHFMIKEAEKELIEALELYHAADLLTDSDDTEFDDFDPSSFGNG